MVTPQERLQAQIEWVLSTSQGREFCWWLLDTVAMLNGQTFAGEHTHQTAFHAGRRQVALELMLELQRFAPMQYRQMLQEAFARMPVPEPVRQPAD